jgi:hypothetical protein
LKQKKLTVMEIKAMEPKAEIYELSPYCKYIVLVKRSQIEGAGRFAIETARHITQRFHELKIPCIVLANIDNEVEFLEIK